MARHEASLADLALGPPLRLLGLDAAQAARHPAPPWVWSLSVLVLDGIFRNQWGQKGMKLGIITYRL